MSMKTDVGSQSDCRLIVRSYLSNLLEAKRTEAYSSIFSAIENGLPLQDVYLKVVQPSMYEVGRLWQTNKIDIAIEHYFSAATQLLMGQLFPLAMQSKRKGLKMAGCCLGSELHELGLRMVSDFFELEGWDTYFMGAITPSNSLKDVLHNYQPDILCLSATMNIGVPTIRDLIHDIRQDKSLKNTKILVGGIAFLVNKTLAATVGADGTASDAKQAVCVASKLLEGA